MLTRVASASDCAGIALLVEQYWQFEQIRGFERARIERLLTELLRRPDQGMCWVAEDGSSICGYLLAVFMFSLEHGGRTAEIDELYVTPEQRCAGVGSLLMTAAERDMSGRGLVRVQLQIGTANRRGRLFYERSGYRGRTGFALMDKPLG